MWISLQTGEVLGCNPDEPFEDAVFDDSFSLPEEQVGLVDDQDEWLPGWYLSQEVCDDAQEGAIKMQTARLLKQIKARRLYRRHVYGARLEGRVQHDMDNQKGKKKSVDYAHGRCGWRKSKRVEVTDSAAALRWAAVNCEAAVKVTTTLLTSALPKGSECPGVARVEASTFYARGAK